MSNKSLKYNMSKSKLLISPTHLPEHIRLQPFLTQLMATPHFQFFTSKELGIILDAIVSLITTSKLVGSTLKLYPEFI